MCEEKFAEAERSIIGACEDIVWIVQNKPINDEWQMEILYRIKVITEAIEKLKE
jgi:hypothetical protein